MKGVPAAHLAAEASCMDALREVQQALKRAYHLPDDMDYEAAMAQKLAASVDDRAMLPIREQQLHAHHEYAAYAFVVLASGLIGFFIRGWI